ncbi:MAG TPA: hypothetical protein PKO28_00230 [Bacilli bacterium]|nr:hypothetical protein [Bacilli bacterium]HPS18698.1 hypothetical protein [Bacilli bacterium]
MRRLWAYIVLAFTALVVVGTTFIGEITKVNSNNQFENGREITFRISDKDEEDVEFQDTTAVDNITKMMKKRLNTAKVTSYEILTVGYDTVKVRLTEKTSSDYQNISTYLTFNGNLGLTYGDDALTADEFLLEGKKATISTYQGYPAILLPVNTTPVDELLQVARDDLSEEDHTYAEESSSGQSEEKTYKYFLYLWYDYEEGKCNFEAATDSNNKYNSRLLMKFEVSSDPKIQYYKDDDNNRLFSLINLDTNSDGKASVDEKTFAYNNARFFINLINAGAIDYKVQFMYEERITSSIETLINYDRLAWNRTMSATLFVLVVLALILVIYYRMGALAIGTLSISSAYLGLLSTIWFSAEFSIFGVLGVIAVAVASIASGAIYMSKLKSEAYRGRSLKKANTEASKKSLLPIIDINIIVIVFGVFAYLFGGAIFRAFGAITVIGGLCSLLLNTLGLKGMMWLATNATALNGKYEMFGINSERVPNIINEEKQSYFGAYAEKDFTKRHKLVSIISAVLFVACLGGSITFAALNGDNAFVNRNAAYSSQIYFEAKTTSDTETSPFDEKTIYDFLSNVYLYEKTDSGYDISATPLYDADGEGKATKDNHVIDLLISDPYAEVLEEETITHHYYVVALDIVLSDKTLGLYNDGTIVQTTDDRNINDHLADAVSDLEYDTTKTSISLKSLKSSETSSVKFSSVGLAIGVSIAVLGLYFVLRYRLSRGLASIVVTTAVSGVILGVLSLARLPVSSLVLAAVPAVAMFAMMISVIIMNREREMVLEDKNHDNSVENRHQLAVKATSYAFTCVSAVAIFVGWIALGFFGFGPDASAWIYGLLFLGVVFATWIVTVLFAPISSFFFKLFKNVNIKRKPRKSKKVSARHPNKSAEPEEAVFIGIND